METDKSGYQYTQSEEFAENLRKQEVFYYNYFNEERYHSNLPFGGEFGYHYCEFRACLASLRNNPDTMNDADFVELCNYWQEQETKSILVPAQEYRNHPNNVFLPCIDFDGLQQRYEKLKKKPVFSDNPYFERIYGAFIKGIYFLFTNQAPYWSCFFGID